jgi:DNA repair exonuclease SbcCD ATPase subunit
MKEQVDFFKDEVKNLRAQLEALQKNNSEAQLAALRSQVDKEQALNALNCQGNLNAGLRQDNEALRKRCDDLDQMVGELQVNWTLGLSPLLEVN